MLNKFYINLMDIKIKIRFYQFLFISTSLWVAIISNSVFVALGPDFAEYKYFYEKSSECFECVTEGQGYIFSYILRAFNSAGLEFSSFLYCLTAMLLAGKIYIVAKIYRSVPVAATFIYLTSFFLIHELIQIRLATASLFAFCAVYALFFLKRKIVSTALLVISALIHPSIAVVICFGALYFVLRRVSIVYYLFILSLLFGIVFVFEFKVDQWFLSFLFNFDTLNINKYAYELLAETDVDASFFSSYTLDLLFTLVVFYAVSSRERADSKLQTLLNMLAFLALCGVAIKVFTSNSPVVSFRLLEIFSMGLFFIKGWILHVLFRKNVVFALLMFMFFLVSNVYIYIINGPFSAS